MVDTYATASSTISPTSNPPQSTPMPALSRKRSIDTSDHDNDNESSEQQASSALSPPRKRNKYVAVACTECKRRKIKCNGHSPCARCSNLHLTCFYKPRAGTVVDLDQQCSPTLHSEFERVMTQLETLTHTVHQLVETSSMSRNTVANTDHHGAPKAANKGDELTDFEEIRQRRRAFSGPTSSRFSFDVARKSLAGMGIQEGFEDGSGDGEGECEESGSVHGEASPANGGPGGNAKPSPTNRGKSSVLLSLSREEACRLLGVYDAEINSMYPFIEMDGFRRKYLPLWTPADQLSPGTGLAELSNYTTHELSQLKLVLAIAMAIEERDGPEGQSLYEEVLKSCERKVVEGDADIETVVLLLLVHKYQFHTDLESQAYRTIGFAVRLCLELGLHRSEELERLYPDLEEREWIVRLFWVVYVLDRRLAFSTGRPFTLRDEDIQQVMPRFQDAEDDLDSPDVSRVLYLKAMISYSRLSSLVWSAVSKLGSEPRLDQTLKEELQCLDFRISKWQQSLPEQLKFTPSDLDRVLPSPHWFRKLQILLYIRANQLRILTYRPILFTSERIAANIDFAKSVVETAKDTIRVLARINETSGIYKACQIHYNYFLVSALAVVLMGIVHAPGIIGPVSKCEFESALGLIALLSKRSKISSRLWKTIKGLRGLAPKLGLSTDGGRTAIPEQQNLDVPRDSVEKFEATSQEYSFLGTGLHHPANATVAGLSPLDGFGISSELNDLFSQSLAGTTGEVLGEGGFVAETGGVWEEGDLVRILGGLF